MGPLRFVSCSREIPGNGAQFSIARPHKETVPSKGFLDLHKRQPVSIIEPETAAPRKDTLFSVTDQEIISVVDFQPPPPPSRYPVNREDKRFILGLAHFQLDGQ